MTYSEARKIEDRARSAIAGAIRKGILPKAATLECIDCGKPAFGYDHRSYAYPLAVVPVCPGCNVRRGPSVEWGGSWFPVNGKYRRRK